MNNRQYWINRANKRMDGYMLSAYQEANILKKSYRDLQRYVDEEMQKILHHVGNDTAAYEWRMKRLAALLEDVKTKVNELYHLNLNDTTKFLKGIIPEAYYRTIFDYSQGVGELVTFASMNSKVIDEILKYPWSGEHYSKRIWKNTKKMSNDLQQALTTAAMNGESIFKTSRKMSAIFGTSAYCAQRLIRTETNYVCGQAEIASYKELDIMEYEFVATLDTRTSEICRELDGKIFPCEDAQPGVNYPPMHPNCRSTTIAYFPNARPQFRAARDENGKRITVPHDMKYAEWYEKYAEGK